MPSLVNDLYEFGEFRLDPHKRTLQQGQDLVALTPKAFDTLLVLVESRGQLIEKDDLMKAVWADSFVEESNLTQTIFMLRKALGQTRDQGYIVTVPGRGYRFVADVKPVPRKTDAEVAPAVEIAVASPPKSEREVLRRVLAVGAIGLLILVGLAYLRWFGPRPAPVERTMLAVLPFDNFTGDPGQEYFSDGLTEEMISQLGNLDPAHLGVIARTSMMQYKHSPKSIPEIGKDLGVQYVVEGSVRRDSQRVRITAQLIQVKDQSHLWAQEYDRDLGSLLELQGEIAREVADKIEFSLNGRRPVEAKRGAASAAPGTKSYEAYDLYLKGRYFWNKRTGEGFSQAASYFQQAIDKDPNYGQAYAGLADTFSLMSTYYVGPQSELMPKARAAALKALQLDESLAEAHASLALIKENYDYDWAGAEKELRRAIQLDPQYATAHQWYAEYLSWQARFDEAFAEIEKARQLDPVSVIIARDHASIFYNSRQFESGLKQCRSITELDPNYDPRGGLMIPFYLELHRYDEALQALDRWKDSSPWSLAWSAAVYGRTGHPEEANRELAKLKQFPSSRPDHTATLLLAYSGTGQKEQMIELLQKAAAEHSNVIALIKVSPWYDPVRDDPRFQDLLRRVGLEK